MALIFQKTSLEQITGSKSRPQGASRVSSILTRADAHEFRPRV